MVSRPTSIPEARRQFREARDRLPHGTTTACEDRPVPFTEIRQTPDDAAALCGRGTENECALLATCAPLGFTESVYADDMVYGGYTWRRGLPLVSEEAFEAKRQKGELKKLAGLNSVIDSEKSA